MDQASFRQIFNATGAVVLPVIHVLDNDQAEKNVRIAMEGGCPGVFLINHDFEYQQFLPIVRHIRHEFPDFWIGVNFLAVTGKDAFPILGDLQRDGTQINAYWADDACINERSSMDEQVEAFAIDKVRKRSGWDGLYFGGTAFKKQREVDPAFYEVSAKIACNHMDVVTTSGIATGHSADIGKIEVFRKACGETAMALASGITAENAHHYADLVDGLLVATGINVDDDFYNIDPRRLEKLLAITNN